jgi:hypothetical protein
MEYQKIVHLYPSKNSGIHINSSKNMKKFFSLSLLFIIGIVLSVSAAQVDLKKAQLVAKNFYYEHINQKQATPYQSITVNDQYTVKVNNQPVYYTISLNNSGFVIVSADDAVTPVLGYSLSGSVSQDNQPENFVAWMEHYRDQIVYVRQNELQPDAAITTAWNHLLSNDASTLTVYRGTTDVAPLLINQNWDQAFPYNAMCPADPAGPDGHCVTGCTATAMAQIMCYWRFPTQGQGYHCIFPTPSYGAQCADFVNTTYDWNGTASQPSKECNLAALISWHAGIAVDMEYGPDASSSYMSKVAPAYINYFRYANTAQIATKTSYSASQWASLMRGDIDLGQPVQYSGNSTASGGHTWVCDGYQGTDYFHMNWGWSGAYNGYFTLTSLNPGGENFNSNQQACVHIKPNSSYYPTYCTGGTTINTNDFGMIEDGSGPADNYQGGTNCSWLIAVDDSVKFVTLSFDRFSLNATDHVNIYDGENASATLLASYTGSALPAAVTTTGSKMFITFTSVAGSTAPGFLASYNTTLNSFCSSSNLITATSGHISDGSGHFQYRNGQSCRWTLNPTDAKTVTLSFSSFSTEQDKDIMKVFDSDNLSTPLAILSGDMTTPPADITSPSGGMMILFSTNKTNRFPGWEADYSITVGTKDLKSFENINIYPNPCDGQLTINFSMADAQNVKIDLVSLQGSVIYTENIDSFKGTYNKTIDLTNVSKGVYMLRMTSDKGICNKKIILQ